MQRHEGKYYVVEGRFHWRSRAREEASQSYWPLYRQILFSVSGGIAMEQKEGRKPEESPREETSSSSNEGLHSFGEDGKESPDDLSLLRRGNQRLGTALEVSKDTTQELKKQGRVVRDTVLKKKGTRKIIGESEVKEREIRRAGNLLDFSNSFFDRIKYFFSRKRRETEAVNKAARKEEGEVKDLEEEAKGTEHVEEASSTGGDIEDELERTLANLKSLRSDVRSQNKRIRAQTHAVKEMEIIDKDTKKRTKKLTKKIKKLG